MFIFIVEVFDLAYLAHPYRLILALLWIVRNVPSLYTLRIVYNLILAQHLLKRVLYTLDHLDALIALVSHHPITRVRFTRECLQLNDISTRAIRFVVLRLTNVTLLYLLV